MSQLTRLWYLSQRRPPMAQASLRIRAVSPELRCSLTWTMEVGEGSDQKIRHLAQLDGCACAFEEWIYEDDKYHNLISWLNYDLRSIQKCASKTIKAGRCVWAIIWKKKKNECAPSEDPDQPGHPPSLIRVFAVRIKKAWTLATHWAHSEDSDQTGRMLSLCWAHTNFVGFVMPWLICFYINEIIHNLLISCTQASVSGWK